MSVSTRKTRARCLPGAPVPQVLPITLSFCAFVICNNISLRYNDVSFYQLVKVLTTPTVVVLQLLLFNVSSKTSKSRNSSGKCVPQNGGQMVPPCNPIAQRQSKQSGPRNARIIHCHLHLQPTSALVEGNHCDGTTACTSSGNDPGLTPNK